MEDDNGTQFCAKYAHFTVGPESDNYRLHVSGYDQTTNGGDSLTANPGIASNKQADGMQFTTPDRDNDLGNGNCADVYDMPWWHCDCTSAVPTGVYGVLVAWKTAKGNIDPFWYMQYSLVPN